MANPNKANCQLSDTSGDPMIGEAQTLIADHSFVYTTDDPGLTAASVTTFADGDLAPAGEVHQLAVDLSAKINAILDVLEAHGLMKDA